jgi:putative ABC transport system permease protein
MQTWLHDLRSGTRALARKPGFAAVVILMLAIGNAANTAVFSAVSGVLLRPLPFPEDDRLLTVWEVNRQQQVARQLASAPNFVDWRERSRSFDALAAFRPSLSYNMTGGDHPVRVSVTAASASLFPLLGVAAALGRTFAPEEDRVGSDLVAIVSHELWLSHFGASPDIIGRKLALHDTTRTVVGVMPPDFEFPLHPGDEADVWIPLALDTREIDGRRDHRWLQVIGRLSPHVSLEQARSDLGAIAGRLQREHPSSNAGWTVELVPFRQQLFGDTRLALLVLQAAVAFLLLIVCVNVANLLLARAEARQKEIAIRAAVGASRLRIVRQLLTESVLLAGLGGLLGLLLVVWGIDLLRSWIPTSTPRVAQIEIDAAVLVGAVAVSLATGVVFGLAPALLVSSPRLHAVLKDGAPGAGGGTGRHRLQGALVVAEVALGLVLLVGATLMAGSFVRLRSVDPGFDPRRVLTMELYLPDYKYSGDHQKIAFYDRLLESVSALPDVQEAALVTGLPMSGRYAWTHGFSIEGGTAAPAAEQPLANWRAVTPDYFRLMRIPLLAGSLFSDRHHERGRKVVLVNESLARRHFAGADPVGRRLTVAGDEPRVVIGVVGNVKQRALAAEPEPEVFVPYHQRPVNYMTLVVRTGSEPVGLADAMGRAVLALDPDQPVFNVRSMEAVVAGSVAGARFHTLLLAMFAGLAVLMAAVGLYSVIAYGVSERTREIGIRLAVGAEPRHVRRLVLGRGLRLALVGVAVGLAAALGLTRMMQSLLYGVSAHDPLTLLGISALLIVVALLACAIPARRAAMVDPAVAVRRP